MLRLWLVCFVLCAFVVNVPAHAQRPADASRPAIMPWDYPPEVREPTEREMDRLRALWTRIFELRAAQNWAEAERVLREDIVLKEATLGPSHPVTGISVATLARTIWELGAYQESETLSVRAITITRRWMPEDDVYFATLYITLAFAQASQGKLALAERSLVRALEIAERGGDANMAQVARTELESLRRAQGQ